MALLPFINLPIPIAAMIYMKTGDYDLALLGHVGLFALAGIAVLLLGGRRIRQPVAAAA